MEAALTHGLRREIGARLHPPPPPGAGAGLIACLSRLLRQIEARMVLALTGRCLASERLMHRLLVLLGFRLLLFAIALLLTIGHGVLPWCVLGTSFARPTSREAQDITV